MKTTSQNQVRMAYMSPRTSHLAIQLSQLIAASGIKQDEKKADSALPDMPCDDFGWETEFYAPVGSDS